MENTKGNLGKKICVVFLTTILLSSVAVLFLNVSPISSVAADASTAAITNELSNRISPLTGLPYGDLSHI